MSHQEKSAYYNALKTAGVTFSRHYREYTTEQLKATYDELTTKGVSLPAIGAAPAAPQLPKEMPLPPEPAFPTVAPAAPPVRAADPEELPGQRQNEEFAPIRTDEQGRVWYQEEVRKPANAQRRGRRVLKYNDPGIRKESAKDGDYTETFEMPGEGRRASEVRITLPSYQVGIYRDPRYPFLIHVYNKNRGFDLQEVQNYFGGADLVPTDVKRIYVENVLAYDMRSVITSINNIARQLRLA